MRSALGILVLLVLVAVGSVAQRPHGAATTRPAQAVRYELIERTNPAQRLHVVRIALDMPGVAICPVKAGTVPTGGKWATSLQTVREIAEREQFDVAVNGDFFSHDQGELGTLSRYSHGAGATTMGPAISNGTVWSKGISPEFNAFTVDARGRLAIATYRSIPKSAVQMICGGVQLVRDGRALTIDGGRWRAPRTAIGFDEDQHTLTLLVVDGRRPGFAAGLTLTELAAEMARLGCDSAMELDGGGSSTLVMRDAATGEHRTINRPSDGYQISDALSFDRPVASAVGIRVRSAVAGR